MGLLTGGVGGEVGGVFVLRGALGTLADAAPTGASQTVAAERLCHEQLAGQRRDLIAVARRLRVAVAGRVRRPASVLLRPTVQLS